MSAINILLVEDDQLDVIDIKRTLDKLNIMYHLWHAKNGEEALEMLNEHSKPGQQEELPDITLLDINMPKMNGIELLQVIRTTEKWKHLKCFVITTSGEKADRTEANALGISGYIIKPLKINSSSNMEVFNLMIDLMNFKKE